MEYLTKQEDSVQLISTDEVAAEHGVHSKTPHSH